jgi:hypothetical protein
MRYQAALLPDWRQPLGLPWIKRKKKPRLSPDSAHLMVARGLGDAMAPVLTDADRHVAAQGGRGGCDLAVAPMKITAVEISADKVWSV